MVTAVNWFEIPSSDFERACKFYSTILAFEFKEPFESMGIKMAFFPYEANNGVGGSIVHGQDLKPSFDGTCVYLNCGEDLAVALGKVEEAGGKICMPKTDIGENGFIALFSDTEGNKVGLHSMN